MGCKLDRNEVNRAKFIVDSLRKYLGKGDLHILDFGCGRGWLAPFLAPFAQL